MKPQTDFLYDVYLSYNHQDKERVRQLAERLRDAKVRVWFDEWVIKPGDDIFLTIEHGLESARALVLCLSPAALGSDWVGLERSTVLFRDPSNAGYRFIPLLLADCNPPDTLRRYKYVDFRQESDAAFQELLITCRPELTPTPQLKLRENAQQPYKPEEIMPLAILDRKLTGHEGGVYNLTFSSDNKRLVSSSHNGETKVWDPGDWSCRHTIREQPGISRSLSIVSNGNNLISISQFSNNVVNIWDLNTGHEPIKWAVNLEGADSIFVLSEGQKALSSSLETGSLKLWDIYTGRCA